MHWFKFNANDNAKRKILIPMEHLKIDATGKLNASGESVGFKGDIDVKDRVWMTT